MSKKKNKLRQLMCTHDCFSDYYFFPYRIHSPRMYNYKKSSAGAVHLSRCKKCCKRQVVLRYYGKDLIVIPEKYWELLKEKRHNTIVFFKKLYLKYEKSNVLSSFSVKDLKDWRSHE